MGLGFHTDVASETSTITDWGAGADSVKSLKNTAATISDPA